MQDNSMHVLIVPSWYFPADSKEIAGRMFHDLCKGLRAKGVDARIFYSEYGMRGPVLKKQIYSEEDSVPTYRVRQWFPPKASSFLLRWWIKKVCNDLLTYMEKYGQPDVLHAQSYLAAAVCNAVFRKTKIPFIYTERLSSFLTGQIPKHHFALLGELFSSAAMMTCVSPGLADVMKSSSKPVRIIPNFFDETIFYPDPTRARNENFTFVSVGEPAGIKGLDILIQAFAGLKQTEKEVKFNLTLVDRIPEEVELKKLAKSLGVDDLITWTGLITQQQLADIFRKSHVLVSASRVETFGKAIVEAQACGLPVVATKTDGAKFIITSPSQGELAEINAKSLEGHMRNVFADYSKYSPKEISENAVKRFSQEKIIGEWIALYKSVTA